jgi:hypothetical protein
MRIFLRILAVLAIVVFVLITALFIYLSDERLREIVIPQVNESLGREVQVDRISFSFFRTFPNFGLVLEGFELPDVEGSHIARFDEMVVSVSLIPLLSNELRINRLDLIRPDVNYIVFADGTTNIDFLMEEEPNAIPADTTAEAMVIDVKQIRVINGNIRYTDLQGDMSAILRDLDLTMSIRLSEFIETDVDANLGGLTFAMEGVDYISDLALSLRQVSELDLENEGLRISEGIFAIRGLGMDISGELRDWSQELMQIDIVLASESDNFGALLELVPDEYLEYVEGIETTGRLLLTGFVKGSLGENVVPDFSMDIRVEDGFMKHPQASKPIESVQIAVIADNNIVEITQFSANADGNRVSLTATINDPLGDDPAFNMDSSLNLDLGTIEAFYPVSDLGFQMRGLATMNARATGTVENAENAQFNADISLNDGYFKYIDLPQAVEQIYVSMNATQDRISISSFAARASQNRISMSGVIHEPLDSNRTSFDIKAEAMMDLATIKDFYPIDEDTLTLRGQFVFDGIAKGTLAIPDQSTVTGLMTLQNGYIAHRDLPKPIRDITLDSRLTANEFQIRNASFRTGDNQMEGSGKIANYMRGTPTMDLKFKASVNLDEIDEYYSLEEFMIAISGKATADLTVRGPVDDFDRIQFSGGVQLSNMSITGDSLPQPITNMNGNMTFSNQDVQLHTFTMMMGSSDFDMQGRLANWRYLMEEPGDDVSPAALTATYRSRNLNIDEIVDWDESSDDPIYIELPNVRSTLTARIDTMTMMGILITDMRGQSETTPKLILLTSASADMFDGGMNGRFDWTVTQPDFTNIHFVGNIVDVRAEAFFKEFQMGVPGNFHNYITGGFSAEADYNAGMDAMFEQDTKSIVANGTFGIARARLQGHPTQVAIAELLNSTELRDLSMDTWNATYEIKDGILTLRNMNLTSRDIGMVMNGSQDLIEDELNYTIQLRLPPRYNDRLASIITAEAVNALKTEDGIVVLPLVLVGSSENPRVTVDRDAIQSIVTEYLKQQGADAIEDAARRLLRGIRGN